MPSAAILAGGRASRYDGIDKGALVVDGRSILDRQLDQLHQLSDDILYVGARPRPEYRGRLREVPDRTPRLGPLAGLDAALAAARHEAVLVVACDMPFLTAGLLRHLVDRLEADAVVPRSSRGRHPLCAAYSRRCSDVVARRLAEGHLAMLDLLEDLRVRDVSGTELEAFGNPDRLLTNVNTANEYDHLASRSDHSR